MSYLRDITDPEGIVQCLEQYGAVGVTNVLTREEADESVRDIEAMLGKLTKNSYFSHRSSIDQLLADPFLNHYGVIGKEALFTKRLSENRYHPNVRRVYSLVYGLPERELISQYDRVAWMRPTFHNGVEKSQYRTPFTSPGLHLDLDPKSYFEEENESLVRGYLNGIDFNGPADFHKENNCKNVRLGRHFLGVLNLMDNDEEDGGFIFSPGGHLTVQQWYHRVKSTLPEAIANGRHFFNKNDFEFHHVERIPAPAGTLIIFDASLPHGGKPNFTSNSRMIQFLRYLPRNCFDKTSLKKRTKLVKKMLKAINYRPREDEELVI